MVKQIYIEFKGECRIFHFDNFEAFDLCLQQYKVIVIVSSSFCSGIGVVVVVVVLTFPWDQMVF